MPTGRKWDSRLFQIHGRCGQPSEHEASALDAWPCCFADAAVTGSNRRPHQVRCVCVCTGCQAERGGSASHSPATSSRLRSAIRHEWMVRADYGYSKGAPRADKDPDPTEVTHMERDLARYAYPAFNARDVAQEARDRDENRNQRCRLCRGLAAA